MYWLGAGILGNPGAASRDYEIFSGDEIFWVESLQTGSATVHLLRPNQFQKGSNSSRWLARKNFSGQSGRRSNRVDSVAFSSYTKLFSLEVVFTGNEVVSHRLS